VGKPGWPAIKTLFALSGNTCYYAGCEEVLTNPNWNSVNAEIAHICGEKPQAPRFDPRLSEKERNAFDNLMLMCPGCHTKIDRLLPSEHPPEVLREMKEKHLLRTPDSTRWVTDDGLDRFVAQLMISLGNMSEEDEEAMLDLAAVAPDSWSNVETVNDYEYRDNVKLWVQVTNKGTTGEFSAQISNTEGFPESWHDYTRPIAWEESEKSVLRIPAKATTRLYLANVARSPMCFWFYGPQDKMYTNDAHTTWQQNRQFDGRIAFDLQIVNLTTNAVAIKRGVVLQGERDELPTFALT
jgi:hypothetical protein